MSVSFVKVSRSISGRLSRGALLLVLTLHLFCGVVLVRSCTVPSTFTHSARRMVQKGASLLSVAGIFALKPISVSASASASASAAAAAAAAVGGGLVEPCSSIDLSRRAISVTAAESAYRPGVLAPDVIYPSWMLGTWQASSQALNVAAPLGAELFGSVAALAAAQAESRVPPLVYPVRWISVPAGDVVADRLFNCESIAAAAMGEDAVLKKTEQTPPLGRSPTDALAESLRLAIVPDLRRGDLFDVVLSTTDRQYGETPDGDFVAYERTRQSLSRRMDFLQESPPPPRVKEIQTTSTYRRVPRGIEALQCTASFLTAKGGDTRTRMILRNEQRALDTAIDVRTYRVLYERKA